MSFSVPRLFRRAGAVVFGVLVMCVFVLSIGGPARADTATLRPVKVVAAAGAACPQQADAGSCDADGDRIPDAVEVVVCGSGTCATGREDADTDGVPDWTEVTACGDVACADPKADADGDGIPDYAETLVCGSVTCSNGYEDTDGNKIADWIDYVICGTAGCATGEEDYNHNGVSDVAELAACVKKDPGFLASTGFQAGMWVLAGVLALGSGAFLYFQNKKKKRGSTDEEGDASVAGGDEGFEEPEDGWHAPLDHDGPAGPGPDPDPDAGGNAGSGAGSVEGGRA